MLLQYSFLVLTSLLACLASPVEKRAFGPVTVFDPTKSQYASKYYSPGTRYARTLQLSNGDILASWENSLLNPTPGPYYNLTFLPVYKSTDSGNSWSFFSNVYDTQNGFGMKWQPFLLQLENGYGNFPAGTVLMAGTGDTPTTGANMSIDLYASGDLGKTWTWVSNIAKGGRAIPSDGYPAIWEAFLMEYNGQLICYYSDQRDPAHSQKLSYITTSDLVNWSAVNNAVAYPTQTDRPGMAVVSKMGNGNYLLTYEYGGAPEGNFAVYYRIASDPTQFQLATGQVLKTTSGHVPTSSPYNVWVNTGGNGTLIANALSDSNIFVNYQYGAGAWTSIPVNSASAYSRGLEVLQNGQVLIINGGPLSRPSGQFSEVTATSIAPPTA